MVVHTSTKSRDIVLKNNRLLPNLIATQLKSIEKLKSMIQNDNSLVNDNNSDSNLNLFNLKSIAYILENEKPYDELTLVPTKIAQILHSLVFSDTDKIDLDTLDTIVGAISSLVGVPHEKMLKYAIETLVKVTTNIDKLLTLDKASVCEQMIENDGLNQLIHAI